MGRLSGHCSRAPGKEQCGIIFYIAFLLFPVYNDYNLRRFPLPTKQKYTSPASLNSSPLESLICNRRRQAAERQGITMSYDFVTQWVLDTVRESYADDIALVISHTTLRMDESRRAISYFVPVTKKGEDFARTFILKGVGYDIWGIPWERLEKFASLEEYNITCLADADILYARTEKDRERFETLQKELAHNLADKGKMRSQALQAYGQAKSIYLEMLFSSGSDVKMGAGYVLDYLGRAVAFSNNSYFKHSQTDQLGELKDMKDVPEGFDTLYMQILLEKDENLQKKGCYQLLRLIQAYLSEKEPEEKCREPREHNFQDLADWYCELVYTWLRIRHYVQANDAVKVYMWGIYLQNELNSVCEDFGIKKVELMKYYDSENLSLIAQKAEEAQQLIRSAITAGGGIIHEYQSEEEFLNEV